MNKFNGLGNIGNLLERAPAHKKLLTDKLNKALEVFKFLEPHLHEVSLRLLEKDIDRWDKLFVQYLQGNSTEEYRLEMKCILSRIQDVREAFNSYHLLMSETKEIK